ncbi:MAG: hypothetical protein PF637_12215 [Spirochaetes bacterium]|nr:hypothetical protein [Spirochaetota bacterium]
MKNRIIICLIKIVVMFALLNIYACSSLSLKKETYSNNILYVYVKIEGSNVAEMDQAELFEEFEKKAATRALGLMIIVLEEEIHDKIIRERVIARLRSFEMKPVLLDYAEGDFYSDAYYRFELSDFQEAIDGTRR